MPNERDMLLGLLREDIGHDGAQGGNLAALPLDPEQMAAVHQFALERGIDQWEPELVLLVKTFGARGFLLAQNILTAGYWAGSLGRLKRRDGL